MRASSSGQRLEARPARVAATALIGSIVAQLVWRTAIAPALLGSIDPASDMPPRQRATLALGLFCGAAIAAIGLALLSRALSATNGHNLSRWAAGSAILGATLLATNIALLFANVHFQGLFLPFALLTTGSWVTTCIACYRAGILRWSALATAALGTLAAVGILVGTFIIFVMSLSLLPLSMGLLFRTRQLASPLAPSSVRPDIA